MPRLRQLWPLCIRSLIVVVVAQGFWGQEARATLLELNRAFIVNALPGESVATLRSRTSTPDAPLTLYLVLEGRQPGRPATYLTYAPGIDLGDGPVSPSQIRRWDNKLDGIIQVRWSQLEPEKRAYDNTTPRFHFEPLVYQEVPLPKVDDHWSWEAAIHPTLMPDPAPDIPTGLGIARFKIRILHQGIKVETPGAAGSYAGGISEDIPWVAYRGIDANPMVSWAQARFNVPYVNGSYRRARSEDSHQAIQGVGTDSIDLLAAAWRLAGHPEVEFSGPFMLEPTHEPMATVLVTRARPEEGGYITQSGRVIEVGPNGILPGDLIKSGNQAGIFARDLEPLGVLDSHDLVISAIFQEPRMGPIQSLLDGPITVLRWNELRELELDLKDLGFYHGPVDGTVHAGVLVAVAEARALVGLAPLESSELEAHLNIRNGTFQVLPAAARFEALRRRADELRLSKAELTALVQRLLARAAEAAGPAGEAGMRWTPPREGLDAQTWQRGKDEPFKPLDASFWNLEKRVDDVAQSFVVADANRDGRIDATGAAALVQAAGPGVVVGVERGWKEKKPAASARAFGNQVWVYLPRPDMLVGYLQLDKIAVTLGQSVDAATTLGEVGRTGDAGSRSRAPTRLRVVAFRGMQGELEPVDPARCWGAVVAPHRLARPLAVAAGPAGTTDPEQARSEAGRDAGSSVAHASDAETQEGTAASSMGETSSNGGSGSGSGANADMDRTHASNPAAGESGSPVTSSPSTPRLPEVAPPASLREEHPPQSELDRKDIPN